MGRDLSALSRWGRCDIIADMRISKKTDYALRVLFSLVERWGQGPMSIQELSRRNDVPKRFLEHILLDLKKQGHVDSLPGRNGGYVLARDPDEIQLGQIVRYFDGVLAPVGCVSVTHYEPCSQEATCRFRRVLLEVRNVSAELMERATLGRIFAGRAVTREEVFELGFVGGDGI